MVQKNWDKYEVALLIEAYQNIKQGRVDKNSALEELSQNLRQMAKNEGLEIDDVFRNMNGMQWQLGFIERAFQGQDYGGRTPPKIFVEMVAVYNENQQKYLSILKCAHERIAQPIKRDVKQENDAGERKTIFDIIGYDYPEFASFCSNAGKIYPDDLTSADYVAFRSQYGVTREYVLSIKAMFLENISILSTPLIELQKNETTSGALDMQGDDEIDNAIDSINEQEIKSDETQYIAKDRLVVPKNETDSADVSELNYQVLETSTESFYDEIFKRTKYPLYKLLGVDNLEDYEYVSVDSFGFSNRFRNVLGRNKIRNVYALLMLTIDDMLQWKGFGKKGIADFIMEIYLFFATEKNKYFLLEKKADKKKNVYAKIKELLSLHMAGVNVDLSILSDKERKIYCSYIEAIEVCGKEIYLAVENSPTFFSTICDSLKKFSEPILKYYQEEQQIFNAYREIPLEFRNKTAKFFVKAYYAKNSDTLKTFWSTIPDQCCISELMAYVQTFIKTSVGHSTEFTKFFNWVSRIDVPVLLQEVFSNKAFIGKNNINVSLRDKYLMALEMRAAGETLENIGKNIDATRERVRQIEKKYSRQFAFYYNNNQYDLLAIIHALRGGDYVLRFEEVEENIGKKYTQLLWLVLSKGLLDNSLYRYSNSYNAVIFTSIEEGEKERIRLALQAIPDYFPIEQFESIVDGVATEFNIHKELLQMDVESKFRLYGTMYSKESITVLFMCGYILKNKFPGGFKIGVADETNRFGAYLLETFGEKGAMTNRAIEAKIGEVGVLCDRGRYIHPDFVQVDKSVVDAINEFIENSPKSVLTYSEIFDSMRTAFNGTQITNRFMLQGVLKLCGCKFAMTRDYVTKEYGKSLTDEFEDFAKSCGEFSKLDFFAEFPALTEANLGMLLGRCKNVFGIDYGIYMHSSLLNLIESDYSEIRKYLNVVCADIPVDAKFLYDEFNIRFIDFMARNEVDGYNKLFGILGYMFGGEFIFSRPYISKNENVNLSKRAIILRRLENYEIIAIDEVVDICNQNGLRYGSVPILIKMVAPDFVRINETMLMRFEQTGITDDVIIEVAQQIAELVALNKYYSSSNIDDFLFYPALPIEWSPYLLESVIDLAGDKIHVIKIPMKSYTTLTNIFVGEEYAEDDYQTFILKVLDEAYDKAFFTTKSEMREWLNERGLITNNCLPNFLEGTNYYFMDSNGVLRKRG